MKEKLKNYLKCLFGKHEWLEKVSFYDFNVTRTCIHCKKTQLNYNGDWYTVK